LCAGDNVAILHSPRQANSAYTKNVVDDIWSHYFLFYYMLVLTASSRCCTNRNLNKKLGARNQWKNYFYGVWTPDSHYHQNTFLLIYKNYHTSFSKN
jgi:hypothetical protein